LQVEDTVATTDGAGWENHLPQFDVQLHPSHCVAWTQQEHKVPVFASQCFLPPWVVFPGLATQSTGRQSYRRNIWIGRVELARSLEGLQWGLYQCSQFGVCATALVVSRG
jgi:hypothetical protein